MEELNMNITYPESDILLNVNGTQLIALDEFTLIKGVQGSGKSRFAFSLIAGLAGYKYFAGLNFIEFPEDKHIIVLSTEMSSRVLQSRLNGLKMALGNLDRIHGYNLLGIEDKWDGLDRELAKYPPHVILIDHVLDYIDNMNDMEQSNILCNKLTVLAKQYGCAVIGIVHQNPNAGFDGKAGGNIGSFLERKAFSAFVVQKRPDGTYRISTTKVREGVEQSWNGDFNDSYKFFNLEARIKEDELSVQLSKINLPDNMKGVGEQISKTMGKTSQKSHEKIIEKWVENGLVIKIKEGNSVLIKRVNEENNEL